VVGAAPITSTGKVTVEEVAAAGVRETVALAETAVFEALVAVTVIVWALLMVEGAV